MSHRPYTLPSRLCRWLTELVLYVSLAVGSTWPLATQITTHLPLAHAPPGVATVPLLNLWTLWWNVHSLERGYRTYWHAPIYYPERWYFAASEPQTLTGLCAWPLWHVLPSSVAVYNVLLLCFLTLNGWFAGRLLERLRVRWALALCGGAAMVVLPLVHWQLGVFQLVSLWGVLWVLHAAVGFRRQPTTRRAVYLGFAFAATYSLCCYYGLFLSLLLLATLPALFGRRLVQWRFWNRSLVAAAVAAVLLLPVVSAQLAFTRAHNISYEEPWVRALSAVPRNYLVQPWARLPLLAGLPGPAEGPAWPLCPGILKLTLAAVGLALGLWLRRTRRRYLGAARHRCRRRWRLVGPLAQLARYHTVPVADGLLSGLRARAQLLSLRLLRADGRGAPGHARTATNLHAGRDLEAPLAACGAGRNTASRWIAGPGNLAGPAGSLRGTASERRNRLDRLALRPGTQRRAAAVHSLA